MNLNRLWAEESASSFLDGAFALLPLDPAELTDEDLDLVAAIAEGLQRHTDDIVEEQQRLVRRLGGDPGTAALEKAASDQQVLVQLAEASVRAHERLSAYTAGALRASGADLERLIVAERPTTRRDPWTRKSS